MEDVITVDSMQQALREGIDVEGLVNHAGWKIVVRLLELDALEAWGKLKDVNPRDTEKIIELQNEIKLFRRIMEKVQIALQGKQYAVEALQQENEVE